MTIQLADSVVMVLQFFSLVERPGIKAEWILLVMCSCGCRCNLIQGSQGKGIRICGYLSLEVYSSLGRDRMPLKGRVLGEESVEEWGRGSQIVGVVPSLLRSGKKTKQKLSFHSDKCFNIGCTVILITLNVSWNISSEIHPHQIGQIALAFTLLTFPQHPGL